MVSVQSPPGGRELPYARVLLPPAILLAAVTGTAAALVTGPGRAAIGWCGAITTVLVLAVASQMVRRGRQVRALQSELVSRTSYLEHRVANHDQEFLRLGREIMPSLLERLRRGESPSEVIRRGIEQNPDYRELPGAQKSLCRMLITIVDREAARRDSSQRAFVNIARRVQAIVHQQNVELREMEEDHGRNPEVFDDLLRIDHATALIGRLADSIAIIGGGHPGRTWPEPVPLYSVLRGAMCRILEYRRIELHSIAKVNIGGTSVEPLIHALAELLDNATRYSPPQTKVHVTAVEVQTGIAIEIEDAGVSLSEESRNRAEEMLARAMEGTDFQSFGDTPRLGLAVVGRLATMYNIQVSLRQSAYGGVRAVLIVPTNMLTDEPATSFAHGIGAAAVPIINNDGVQPPERAAKRRRPTTGPRVPSSAESLRDLEDDVPVVTEWTPGGLPQRRSRVKTPLSRRMAEAAAAEAAAEAARKAAPVWEPEPEPYEPPGAWVEEFWAGFKGDRSDPFTRTADDAASTADNQPAPAEAGDEGDLK